MDEQRYKVWWPLHLRVALGETLTAVELEAEEQAELRREVTEVRALQAQWRILLARNQQLAQEEAALRDRAAELERNYRALTGESLVPS